jgi:hypothetical protein
VFSTPGWIFHEGCERGASGMNLNAHRVGSTGQILSAPILSNAMLMR